jgi:acid stress-induced BolA-like protein IbaG/YrbA
MHNNSIPASELCAAMHERIIEALPGSEVKVTGGGGHFEIHVISSAFEGLNTLKKQRLVYGAIKELMAGDNAPVHAIDRMVTEVPG